MIQLVVRIRAVMKQWLDEIALRTRRIVWTGMRMTRFERWSVRPISEARFRALNQRIAELTGRNAALTAKLDQARSTIEHLRRVEKAYREACERLDSLRSGG